ncbi:MAG: ion channel [Maricaulaceae bacterium]|jgi:hypothetical protein
MLANLVLATVMVAVTVLIHFFGLAALMILLNRRARDIHQEARVWRQGAAIVAVIFGLFAVHTVEIWTYAALYRFLGEFDTLEAALYFSASTFTTVGFGDIYLDESWRLLSAIESANGFLLIGWSTAFLISVTARLRALELEWTERREEAQAERGDA